MDIQGRIGGGPPGLRGQQGLPPPRLRSQYMMERMERMERHASGEGVWDVPLSLRSRGGRRIIELDPSMSKAVADATKAIQLDPSMSKAYFSGWVQPFKEEMEILGLYMGGLCLGGSVERNTRIFRDASCGERNTTWAACP
ncbi:E3 ubiquitin-protein ligase HIP1 [Carex littledalei]|uniref:E3 ubiquitin-protein ligase HIP1 n=1 Tax=Carex littledalei TaxID=544730 RepID=A0A833QKV6_9POAL|nr:E3 ubiquitin-protein ligase HIP1 [Carex littledalei]